MRLLVSFFMLGVVALFASTITRFTYEGAINPASSAYVQKALTHAQNSNASLVVFELDTPGGLLSSTRDIVSQILNSKIPVVVYVSPKGARAASAGTFILYAAHISAMSQGSNVGAATPVRMTQMQSEGNTTSAMQTKAINDAVAYIESLAKLREKNVEWAKQSVSEGASIDSQKALEIGVIDLIADDFDDLLVRLDGYEIKMDEKTVRLQTKNATVETVEAGFKTRVLSYLSNPNIAYILMLVAIYGIFFELMNPGSIFPGVTGLISGALALYALNILPFDYAGLLLIFIGIALMAAEVFVVGFGILGIGGIIAFVLGSLILFDEKTLGVDISLSLIVAFTLVSAAVFIYLLKVIVSERKQKPHTGIEQMQGGVAKVVGKSQNGYKVAIHSEIWNAVSQAQFAIGDEVIVERIEGLTLHIKAKE